MMILRFEKEIWFWSLLIRSKTTTIGRECED